MKQFDLREELIEKCKKGDRDAQYRLYRNYSKAMYNICLRMVNNEMDAEDILQNSFIDVFTHLDSFNYKSTPGAWIKRIVINNCINFLKRKRMYFEEVDERVGEIVEEGVDESVLNVKAINNAIGKLPDGYRSVFSLYAMEGYDHKEIGQILGVSEATSKSQYSRAKQKLRKILLADMESQVFINNQS